MTPKEEIIESYHYCISDYVSKLNNRVQKGDITQNDISTALHSIRMLVVVANNFVSGNVEKETALELFLKEQMKLNKLLDVM